jgi:hypothetical protein
MNSLRQIDAVDVLHDNEVLIFDAAKVVHADNVVVLELTQQPRFGNQLPNEILVEREPTMQSFQRDHSAEALVATALCKEHLSHSSFADLAKQVELTADDREVSHVVLSSFDERE